jgi:hypothetical protein
VLAASGAEQRVATSPDQGPILDAALSPDGQQVVYARVAPGDSGDFGGALYVVPASGGTPRLLLDHDARGAMLTTPIWSADGASILYTYTPYVVGSTGPDAEPRIERIRLDGTGREVLIREATTPAPAEAGTQKDFPFGPGTAFDHVAITNVGSAINIAAGTGNVAQQQIVGKASPRPR